MSESFHNIPEDKELQIFVGRQSILDTRMEIYGYELLFRSGLDNVFSHIDGDLATSAVISNSFFNLGFSNITQGRKAAINFTRNVLVGNYAQLLPQEILIVEILEDVEPDPEVIDAVSHLKNEGYLIALDDYKGDRFQNPLIEYVDLIKVDFSQAPPEKQLEFVDNFKPQGIEMLAEKVETQDEFESAMAMGYTLFQGYFFCKPTIISGNRIPGAKIARMRLLNEANKPDFDARRIEEWLAGDAPLSKKIMRFVNTALSDGNGEATSIKQAMQRMSVGELRKWISLGALTGLGCDKPRALLVTATVRARFCELLGGLFGLKGREDDLFLLGMLSTIDALLDVPMDKAIQEIPMPEDLRAALLGGPCHLAHVLNIAIGYETGDWALFEESTKGDDVDENAIPPLHLEAVRLADEILGGNTG